MECKYALFIMFDKLYFELIDTLWNVNIMDGKYFSVIKKELIDTLWNVNLILRQRVLQQQQRINRYIMECKYHKHQRQFRTA